MKWLSALMLAGLASGQQVDLSILDKLAARAKSSVNVTLDEDKLKFASAFLSHEDSSQAAAKNIVGGLKAINVRVFEFDNTDAFTSADLDAVRAQLRQPGWTKIIEARERDESAEIYTFGKGKAIEGLMIIAAEKRELAIVNIVGPVDMNTLGSLAGKFGIPGKLPAGVQTPPKPPQPPTPPAKPRNDE